jgi:hypothetical protein
VEVLKAPGTKHQAPEKLQAPNSKRDDWASKVGVAVLLALALAVSSARGQVSREYPIKAAFMFNFAQFTEWPGHAFASPDSPMVIGVLGTDPFGTVLDDTARNEAVRGHRLVVERYRALEEMKTCHMLYIAQSEASHLDQVLAALKGKPVLTFSDIEGSAPRGVMVRFFPERNKIRLRINVEAARAADLTISSKVLRAAEIVGMEKK